MILFDTDTISELMRKRPSQKLMRRIAEMPVHEQATTAITIAELCYGAHRAERSELFDAVMRILARVRVFGFDATAARVYGPLRSRLERYRDETRTCASRRSRSLIAYALRRGTYGTSRAYRSSRWRTGSAESE